MAERTAIGAFKGSNNIKEYSKSIINVSKDATDTTSVNATSAFERTVEFTPDDIGYTTSKNKNTFESPISSEKAGVTVNVTNAQKQRSTTTQGDPEMLNGIPRSGNSAVDVLPSMTVGKRGIASVGKGLGITADPEAALFPYRETGPVGRDYLCLSNKPTNRYETSAKHYYDVVVNGDMNTFYPINVSNSSDTCCLMLPSRIAIDCMLYDKPCASYPENHPTGTSSSRFIITMLNYEWSNAGHMINVEYYREYYARLIGKWSNAGYGAFGITVWLRGGGTKYRIWSENIAYLRGPFYERTDIGNTGSAGEQHSVWVEPLALSNVISPEDMVYGWSANSGFGALYATSFKCKGDIHANKVYEAVWNDYAEFFQRGCHTEPGDVIALDTDSDTEQYILADKTHSRVVGVHSDSYGHILGGERPTDKTDFEQFNIDKFIPVGLVGRVGTKIKGKLAKGDYVVPSDTPGVGIKYNPKVDDPLSVFGIACETKTDEDIRRVKVYLKK